jgi:hypothetical protein
MKNGAIIKAALVVILSAFAPSQPASAQNALGGAAKQNSPVMPANKAGANAVSTTSKCAGGSCAVKGHK